MTMLPLKPERFDTAEYRAHSLSVCGKSFIADMSGALYWPGQGMLIVADMHLGKGSFHATRGQMLPPYDTRDTLLRLARVLDVYQAETVVVLGDSFHDPAAFERMDDEDRQILELIQEGRRWIWITGNHDPQIAPAAGGERAGIMHISGLSFQHEPGAGQTTHEIAGHMHPAARLSLYGYILRRPCFIGNRRRLIIPAFGSYAGGLNVLDPAFSAMFGNDGFSIWMLGEEGLYPVATRQLRPDHG